MSSWECHRCGAVNAPHATQCSCKRAKAPPGLLDFRPPGVARPSTTVPDLGRPEYITDWVFHPSETCAS